MSNQTKNNRSDERQISEGKKKKRRVVAPFILCLLIAFAIWLYASANAEEQESQETSTIQIETDPSVFGSVL